ncbi:MAG: DUF308 domain-containing protein [Treponema sp.]|nr:DUF308 domain-containing protein [Treponema sp.]
MKRNWIIGISTSVAGLLLLISPSFCIKLILILFGLTAVIEGIYGIISERELFDDVFFQKTILYKSIGNIIIGLLSLIMPLTIAGVAWTIMTYVLAFYLLISGCAGFLASSKVKQTNESEKDDSKELKIENIITLASGILLLFIGPEKLGTLILRILGAVSLIIGICFILVQVLEKKKEKVITDVKVSDDDSDNDSIDESIDDSIEDSITVTTETTESTDSE